MVIKAKCGDVLNIGKQGENLARSVEFDITKWQAEYGDGYAQLIVQRNGDPAAYPATITEQDGIVTWAITSADNANVGYGSAELRYIVDLVVVKSVTYTIYVAKSLDGSGEAPEPWQSWVDEVLEAGEEAREAREAWENMDAVAETLPAGSDATASYSAGTLTLGIPRGDRGERGERGLQGERGEQGIQGERGEQGVQGEKGDKGDSGTTDFNELENKPTTLAGYGITDAATKTELANTDLRLHYLYELTRGQAWDIATDNGYGTSKTVPAGALAVDINSINGQSVMYNQLVNLSVFPQTFTQNGISFTVTDYGISASGTATGTAVLRGNLGSSFALQAGHKYFLGTCPAGGSSTTYAVFIGSSTGTSGGAFSANNDFGGGMIFTMSGAVYNPQVQIIVRAGQTMSNKMFVANLYDLTVMFGAGNEPATAAEAIARGVPTTQEAYNAGQLQHAAVDLVATGDDTLIIPEAVRALAGYGQSNLGGEANVLDFENGIYHKRGEWVNGTWTSGEEDIDISSYFDGIPVLQTEAGMSVDLDSEFGVSPKSALTYYIKLTEAI